MSAFVPVPGCATRFRVLNQAPPSAPVVERGDVVVVHAKGVVKETQKTFWSTKDPGQKPFEYTAGVGGVITGASRASSSRARRARARPRRAAPHGWRWTVAERNAGGGDRGCHGARGGETRELDIPASEGYGAGGFPAWGIPPNGALVFEIEVLSVRGK